MQDGRVGPWQTKATAMYMITSSSSIKRNLQDPTKYIERSDKNTHLGNSSVCSQTKTKLGHTIKILLHNMLRFYDLEETYVSLQFLHHTVLLKRRACFLKRNVFPCILAVLSTSSSKRSPLSRTLSMFSIMTFRTCPKNMYVSVNQNDLKTTSFYKIDKVRPDSFHP